MTRSHDRHDTFCAIAWISGAAAAGGDVDFAYSNTVDIDFNALAPNHLPPRGFMVCSIGDVKVTSWDGKTDTFASGELVVGALYPFSIRRIFATGTTVTKVRIFW